MKLLRILKKWLCHNLRHYLGIHVEGLGKSSRYLSEDIRSMVLKRKPPEIRRRLVQYIIFCAFPHCFIEDLLDALTSVMTEDENRKRSLWAR